MPTLPLPRPRLRRAVPAGGVLLPGDVEVVDPEIIELSDEIFREPILVALRRSRYEARDSDALRPSCRSYTFSLDRLAQSEIEIE